jgi:hypothetical protein
VAAAELGHDAGRPLPLLPRPGVAHGLRTGHHPPGHVLGQVGEPRGLVDRVANHLIGPGAQHQRCGAGDVDEERGDGPQLAAERAPGDHGLLGDRRPHVAAQQVAQPLALGEARDHRVDALLQQPDLAGVVDRHADVVVARADPLHRAAQVAQLRADRAAGQQDGEQSDDREEDDRGLGGPLGVARVEEQQDQTEQGTPLVSPQVSSSRGRTPRPSPPVGGWAWSARAVTWRPIRSASR